MESRETCGMPRTLKSWRSSRKSNILFYSQAHLPARSLVRCEIYQRVIGRMSRSGKKLKKQDII